MSRSVEQVPQNAQREAENAKIEKEVKEKLPMESSPYVKYSNIEEYKQQGYGTQGHMEVKPGQGGGATDGPTPSGSNTDTGLAKGLSTDGSNAQGHP